MHMELRNHSCTPRSLASALRKFGGECYPKRVTQCSQALLVLARLRSLSAAAL